MVYLLDNGGQILTDPIIGDLLTDAEPSRFIDNNGVVIFNWTNIDVVKFIDNNENFLVGSSSFVAPPTSSYTVRKEVYIGP